MSDVIISVENLGKRYRIGGVLDVEADKLKKSVLAILAREFLEPPA